MIRRVAKEDVSKAWPYLGPVLEKALNKAQGERSLDDVRADCESGDSQLWFRGQSALVTQLIEYPRQKVVRLLLCAGRMEDVMPGFGEIKAWARKEDCDAMEICGRRGWIKALGMDETYTVSRIEL